MKNPETIHAFKFEVTCSHVLPIFNDYTKTGTGPPADENFNPILCARSRTQMDSTSL